MCTARKIFKAGQANIIIIIHKHEASPRNPADDAKPHAMLATPLDKKATYITPRRNISPSQKPFSLK